MVEALNLATEGRRELPTALRAFIRDMREFVRVAPFIAGWLVAIPLIRFPVGFHVFFGAMTAYLLQVAVRRARKVLRAGYTHDDARYALQDDLERRLEVYRTELGTTHTRFERLLNGARLLMLSVFLVALVLDFTSLGRWPYWGLIWLGALILAFLAVVALRRDWIGDTALRLARGPFGRLTFGVAGIGLKPARVASVDFRPTELVLSIAADRLFDELPWSVRRQLMGLPTAMLRLEELAQVMRRRVTTLDFEAAQSSDGRGHGDSREDGAAGSAEHKRHGARRRLDAAVMNLEQIRFELLRLHAGEGEVRVLAQQIESAAELTDGR